MRVDGDLHLWHVQENTMPEAITAVVKDRSKNVDRFERETSQDGFIERNIDGHNIRFRVSILPVVSTEFMHKHESVVIRVLDDRKVITDIEKLGLIGPARDNFYKAISKPQGIVILTGPTGSGKEYHAHRSTAPGYRSHGERAHGRRSGRVHYLWSSSAEARR
jgi:type IV pilus assembly protein PilB